MLESLFPDTAESTMDFFGHDVPGLEDAWIASPSSEYTVSPSIVPSTAMVGEAGGLEMNDSCYPSIQEGHETNTRVYDDQQHERLKMSLLEGAFNDLRDTSSTELFAPMTKHPTEWKCFPESPKCFPNNSSRTFQSDLNEYGSKSCLSLNPPTHNMAANRSGCQSPAPSAVQPLAQNQTMEHHVDSSSPRVVHIVPQSRTNIPRVVKQTNAQALERRARNTEAARRSRRRAKSRIQELEDMVTQLRQENESLKGHTA